MLEYFIYCYGNQLLMLVLCAIAGTLGYGLRRVWLTVKPKLEKFVDRYIDDDTKRKVAETAARYVEQAWKSLHGSEKMDKALETAAALLDKKGIDCDAEEMRYLIEAFVLEFNSGLYADYVAGIPDSAGSEGKELP